MSHSTAALDDLISIHIDPTAPEVLVYSPTDSPRLRYTCDFVFHRVLRTRYALVSDSTHKNGATPIHINYSTGEIPGALRIVPQGLLFEQGLQAFTPELQQAEGGLRLFGKNFDVFSAVFWCISRYEEWVNPERDKHGRFEAAQSLLYKNNLHLVPWVDRWIMELRDQLVLFFPGTALPQPIPRAISTLDIDNLYAYRYKGLVRLAGGAVRDLFAGRWTGVVERMQTLLNRRSDPFDVYEEVAELCSQSNIPLFCFFLFRSGTAFDRTVDPRSGAFEPVFDRLKKKGAAIGLHPSYYTVDEPERLAREVKDFSTRVGDTLLMSRQHYLRFDVRTTPRLLESNGIAADFTMGFASAPGFRAATAYPFPYYNFDLERASRLIAVPFCAMDGAYFIYGATSPGDSLASMLDLWLQVQQTGGNFITVFHERTFSNHLYPGFGTLYKKLLLHMKDGRERQ